MGFDKVYVIYYQFLKPHLAKSIPQNFTLHREFKYAVTSPSTALIIRGLNARCHMIDVRKLKMWKGTALRRRELVKRIRGSYP